LADELSESFSSRHLSATLFERGSHIALRAKERRDMETVP
jgi:hypothetical protein